MSKNINIVAILAVLGVLLNMECILANDCHTPQRRYYQQVPHVVLPQTIEYHPSAKTNTTGRIEAGGYRNYHPATYTAYPSYESDEALRFRTINQVSYPVTPESPAWSTPEQAAEYWQNHQVQVQKPAWVKEPEKEDFSPQPQTPQLQPTIPANVKPYPGQDQSASEKKWTSSSQSLVFVKSQRENAIAYDAKPGQLLKTSVAKATANPLWDTDWWMNAGDFELALQVSYNQPASTTANTASALASNVPDYSAILQQFQMQQAQPAPAYAAGCMTYGNGPCMGGGAVRQGYGYHGLCNRQHGYGYPTYCQPQSQSTYSPQVIQDAWNAYFKAYNTQHSGIMPVSGMTPGMSQPGMMPQQGRAGLPNYGYMAFNPSAMQQSMPQMPQHQAPQTLGYIVLYPNQNQDGKANGNTDGSDPQQNMKAVFVPFDSQQGMNIQSAMNTQQVHQGMMNPMNPWMNPMAMGMMNPWMNPMMGMMNPYMMGMGQPQIIIQLPQQQGRERQGLFAKRRQQKSASAATPTATATFGSPVCNDGSYSHFRIPAKAAYPYGYFGAQTEPYKTGNFGGYGDTQFSNITYPGF